MNVVLVCVALCLLLNCLSVKTICSAVNLSKIKLKCFIPHCVNVFLSFVLFVVCDIQFQKVQSCLRGMYTRHYPH